MCSTQRLGVGPITTGTSSQRGRTQRWITTFGEHFGAGRGADTLASRAGGFGGNTSELRITGTGCLQPKPAEMKVNRECCR